MGFLKMKKKMIMLNLFLCICLYFSLISPIQAIGGFQLYSHVIDRVNIHDIAYDVFSQENYVYVTGNKGLYIIDISNPTRGNPIEFDSYDFALSREKWYLDR